MKDTRLPYLLRVNPLYIIFGALFIVIIPLLVWSSFAELEQKSTTRGIVIAADKTQKIQASIDGVVDNILVKEGQKVKKGDILVVLEKKQNQASLDAATSAAGKSAAVGVIASGKAVGDTISASAAGRAGVGDLQGRLAKEAQSISNSQAALAAASANTASKSITHQLSTQTAASAIAGQAARDIMSSATTQANTKVTLVSTGESRNSM